MIYAKTRDRFLADRKQWRKEVEHFNNKHGGAAIIIDLGDEIICDMCNAEIEGDTVTIKNDYAMCGKCLMERYGA